DTHIAAYAFKNVDMITKVTLPATLEAADEYAFTHADNLVTVTFTDDCPKLSLISEGLFKDCVSLEMDHLTPYITRIDDFAFENCCSENFTEFTISDNVVYIGTAIFRGTTNLAKITIPFVGRENGIDAGDTVDSYEMFGWIYGIKEDAEDINDNLNYTIEEVLDEVVITSDTHIAAYAFKNVDMITKVTLPATLEAADKYAFTHADSLETVTFTDGCPLMDTISEGLFKDCVSLVMHELPETIVYIKDRAFENCCAEGFNEFTITNNVEEIGAYAYLDCSNLVTFNYPADTKVTLVSEGTFMNCTSLEMHELPNAITRIDAYAFKNCSSEAFDSFTISDNVTFIGHEVFADCIYLETLTIPFVGQERGIITTDPVQDGMNKNVFGWLFGLKQVMTFALDYTLNDYAVVENLTSVVVTDDVAIADEAFLNCSYITSVKLNEGVVSIGEKAFKNSGLLDFEVPSTVESIGKEAFMDTSDMESFLFKGQLVTRIEDSTFYNASSLVDFNLATDPAGFYLYPEITYLGNSAFRNTGFTEVTVPATIEHLGSHIFADSVNLEKTSIYTSTLGEYMYENDHALSTAYLYSSTISSVAVGAFKECWNLVNFNSETEFNLNPTLRIIEEQAFYGLRTLGELNLPESVEILEEESFAYLTSLLSLTLKETITTIEEGAFYGTCELEELYLPFIGRSLDAANGTKESLFGWIFGETAYTDYPDDSHDVSHGVEVEQYAMAENVTYTFYIPYKLFHIELSEQITVINAYVFQNVIMVDYIDVPWNVNTIYTHAFAGCWDLKYVEVPTTATQLEYQIFIDMESPEEAVLEAANDPEYEPFFIIAHYRPDYVPVSPSAEDIDSRYERPAGWQLYVDGLRTLPTGGTEPENNKYRTPDGKLEYQFDYEEAIGTRWHTKYIVYVEDRDIFIYEYDAEQQAFYIIGYTQYFMGGRIVVPATYATKPVIGIREGAIESYLDKALMYENDVYKPVTSFEIGENVETIGERALPGGMTMNVYVRKTKEDANYGDENLWVGNNNGMALVYYGYLDTTSTEEARDRLKSTERDLEHSWTLSSGDAYQLLVNGLDVTLTLEDKDSIYTGNEITPTPIVKTTAVQVGQSGTTDDFGKILDSIFPDLALYQGGTYRATYTNNLNTNEWYKKFEKGVVPTILLEANDSRFAGKQKITFNIVKATLTIDLTDEKMFNEQIWSLDSWNDATE
ncbi:MAG: leucine-rich repeat domain-containing protein, partial [Anaeroplasmataceae bacterium]|nr:leucine-rich repeat domain-containing protein [Anaeroplasmataceae bacterium]